MMHSRKSRRDTMKKKSSMKRSTSKTSSGRNFSQKVKEANEKRRKARAAKAAANKKKMDASSSKLAARKKAARTGSATMRSSNEGAGGRSRNLASSKITGRTMTRAGEYKTFAKDSSAAKGFRKAFAAAKKDGKKTFMWNGKRYTTKTK